MESNLMVKTCSKCNEEKPLEGFGKNAKARGGLQARCKACEAAYNKTYREANKEKEIARTKAYREANPEKVAAKNKAWRAANLEKAHAYDKAWRESHPYAALAGVAKGRAKRCNALPSWYSQKHHDQIIGILEERDRLTAATGIPHEIDHILPINGDTVSGLHIPENLQIITKTENRSKGNKHDFS